MHFGQKDTEDDSVRITIFLQVRPLHLKGVSFFTSFSLSESTVESEEEYEDEVDATPSPLSSPTTFVTLSISIDSDHNLGVWDVGLIDLDLRRFY